MAIRTIYTKALLDKKTKTFEFAGVIKDVFGTPGQRGIWLIYGSEKHGKTWFSVKLAEYLGTFTKVLYVSAEEGTDDTFQSTIIRARIDPKNRAVKWIDYVELTELDEYLSKRQAPKVIFIDNMTIYKEEFRGAFRQFTQKHSDKLFICIAHEDKNEPYTATAKLAKRLAKIIVRVVGLTAFVSGRCPGGELTIDEQKARLYHGSPNTKN